MRVLLGLAWCYRRRWPSPPSAPSWWRWSSRNSRRVARKSARAGWCATPKFIGRSVSGPRRGSPHSRDGWWSGLSKARFSALRAIANSCYMRAAAVGDAVRKAASPLVGDPKRGIFRIYRDVRFSPDKRLYKTHAGAVLTRSGRKRDPGLLYLHVAPGESMVAAGFWHPEPGLLSRLRRAILHDPDEFLAIKDRLIAAGHPIFSGQRLSRPPRGFEGAKDSPVAEYVCWKSFTAHAALSDAEMQS